MGERCESCGKLTKHAIQCKRCQKKICFFDFNLKTGLCPECDILLYNEKYKTKIEHYKEHNLVV